MSVKGHFSRLMAEIGKPFSQVTGGVVHRGICRVFLQRIGLPETEINRLIGRFYLDDKLDDLFRAAATAIVNYPQSPATALPEILCGMLPSDGNAVNRLAKGYFQQAVEDGRITSGDADSTSAVLSHQLGIAFLTQIGAITTDPLLAELDKFNADVSSARRDGSGPLPEPEPLVPSEPVATSSPAEVSTPASV